MPSIKKGKFFMPLNDQLPSDPSAPWQRSQGYKKATGPDPIENPDYFDGVSLKRIFAYVIDFIIVALLGLVGWFAASLVGLLTFGLLLAPLYAALALVPIIYHTLMIGSSRSATFGMHFMGIKVYRLDGRAPDIIQAFVMSALFFFTVPLTSSLILVVALFNPQRRCLHDMLSGTIVLNNVDKT